MKKVFFVCFLALAFSAEGQELVGKVQNEQGDPVAYAYVSIGEQVAAVTDDVGSFTIRGLDEETYIISVRHLSYRTYVDTLDYRAGISPLSITLLSKTYTHGEVEIVGVRADDRTPFAQTIIDREKLDRMDVGVDLPLLMDLEPAVVTTSDAGTGIGYTGIRVRGSDATRVNVTINGAPLNDAESSTVFWVNLPDLVASTDDIQIQRGVGTSTNGPGAFGASINVRTSRVNPEPFGRVSAFGGSFNTRKFNVAAGTGLLNDRFSFDVRLSSLDSDGFIDRATADLEGYFMQGAWLSEKRSLKLILFGGSERTYQAWYGVPDDIIDTNRTYNFYTYDNEVDDYGQDHYQLIYDEQLSKNTSLNLTLYRTDGAGYFEQYKEGETLTDYQISPLILGGDTIGSSDLIRRRWLDNTLLGGNVTVNSSFDGGHRLIAGGGYGRYEGAHFGEVIWAQFANDSEIRDRYYDNDAIKTDGNVFVKFNYALNKEFDLFADVQVRTVGYDFLGIDENGEELDQSVNHSFFNPKAGVVFRPKQGVKYYASVAVGNKEPNRNDFTESAPSVQPRPESMIDYELGGVWRQAKQAIGVNFYYMDYTDQLVLTGELNDVGGPLRVNVSESYRAGVELTWTRRLLNRLTWGGNLALSRNRIRNFTEFVDDWDTGDQAEVFYDETEISFSPGIVSASEMQFGLWESEKVSATVALVSKYVGEQFLDNSGSDAAKLDGWFVNDVRFNWNIKGMKGIRDLAFTINVRNVLNEEYESNGWSYAFINGGERNYLLGLFPQAGTNVLGGVTMRF